MDPRRLPSCVRRWALRERRHPLFVQSPSMAQVSANFYNCQAPGRAWVFISPWRARRSCRFANTLPCAHAGTPLGDPLEVGALGAAFAVGKDVASRTRILGLVSSKVC